MTEKEQKEMNDLAYELASRYAAMVEFVRLKAKNGDDVRKFLQLKETYEREIEQG